MERLSVCKIVTSVVHDVEVSIMKSSEIFMQIKETDFHSIDEKGQHENEVLFKVGVFIKVEGDD